MKLGIVLKTARFTVVSFISSSLSICKVWESLGIDFFMCHFLNCRLFETVTALYGGSYDTVVSSFSEIIIVMFIYCMDQLLISKQRGRLI